MVLVRVHRDDRLMRVHRRMGKFMRIQTDLNQEFEWAQEKLGSCDSWRKKFCFVLFFQHISSMHEQSCVPWIKLVTIRSTMAVKITHTERRFGRLALLNCLELYVSSEPLELWFQTERTFILGAVLGATALTLKQIHMKFTKKPSWFKHMRCNKERDRKTFRQNCSPFFGVSKRCCIIESLGRYYPNQKIVVWPACMSPLGKISYMKIARPNIPI
jgi:hypothetical protein